MGYCIRQGNTEFAIKAENKESALQAIKALVGKETIHDSFGPHFSWVHTEDFMNAQTLEDALDAWRYECVLLRNDIVGINFTGEKYGDDKLLFSAIAPYVEDGSYITMHGEDGETFGWDFKEGKFTELYLN